MAKRKRVKKLQRLSTSESDTKEEKCPKDCGCCNVPQKADDLESSVDSPSRKTEINLVPDSKTKNDSMKEVDSEKEDELEVKGGEEGFTTYKRKGKKIPTNEESCENRIRSDSGSNRDSPDSEGEDENRSHNLKSKKRTESVSSDDIVLGKKNKIQTEDENHKKRIGSHSSSSIKLGSDQQQETNLYNSDDSPLPSLEEIAAMAKQSKECLSATTISFRPENSENEEERKSGKSKPDKTADSNSSDEVVLHKKKKTPASHIRRIKSSGSSSNDESLEKKSRKSRLKEKDESNSSDDVILDKKKKTSSISDASDRDDEEEEIALKTQDKVSRKGRMDLLPKRRGSHRSTAVSHSVKNKEEEKQLRKRQQVKYCENSDLEDDASEKDKSISRRAKSRNRNIEADRSSKNESLDSESEDKGKRSRKSKSKKRTESISSEEVLLDKKKKIPTKDESRKKRIRSHSSSSIESIGSENEKEGKKSRKSRSKEKDESNSSGDVILDKKKKTVSISDASDRDDGEGEIALKKQGNKVSRKGRMDLLPKRRGSHRSTALSHSVKNKEGEKQLRKRQQVKYCENSDLEDDASEKNKVSSYENDDKDSDVDAEDYDDDKSVSTRAKSRKKSIEADRNSKNESLDSEGEDKGKRSRKSKSKKRAESISSEEVLLDKKKKIPTKGDSPGRKKLDISSIIASLESESENEEENSKKSKSMRDSYSSNDVLVNEKNNKKSMDSDVSDVGDKDEEEEIVLKNVEKRVSRKRTIVSPTKHQGSLKSTAVSDTVKNQKGGKQLRRRQPLKYVENSDTEDDASKEKKKIPTKDKKHERRFRSDSSSNHESLDSESEKVDKKSKQSKSIERAESNSSDDFIIDKENRNKKFNASDILSESDNDEEEELPLKKVGRKSPRKKETVSARDKKNLKSNALNDSVSKNKGKKLSEKHKRARRISSSSSEMHVDAVSNTYEDDSDLEEIKIDSLETKSFNKGKSIQLKECCVYLHDIIPQMLSGYFNIKKMSPEKKGEKNASRDKSHEREIKSNRRSSNESLDSVSEKEVKKSRKSKSRKSADSSSSDDVKLVNLKKKKKSSVSDFSDEDFNDEEEEIVVKKGEKKVPRKRKISSSSEDQESIASSVSRTVRNKKGEKQLRKQQRVKYYKRSDLGDNAFSEFSSEYSYSGSDSDSDFENSVDYKGKKYSHSLDKFTRLNIKKRRRSCRKKASKVKYKS